MEDLMKVLAAALLEQMRPAIEEIVATKLGEVARTAAGRALEDIEDDVEVIIERWVDMHPEKFGSNEHDLTETVTDIIENGSFTLNRVEFTAW